MERPLFPDRIAVNHRLLLGYLVACCCFCVLLLVLLVKFSFAAACSNQVCLSVPHRFEGRELFCTRNPLRQFTAQVAWEKDLGTE